MTSALLPGNFAVRMFVIALQWRKDANVYATSAVFDI